MLRLDPLLTMREAVGPVAGLNKHLTETLSPIRGYPRDRFPDTVSTVKTVQQTYASPNRDQNRPVQAQDLATFGTNKAAIMRDIFDSP